MRILRIRFVNLNSLVGESTIDLTHPAFVSDGIFAITGPTGAGKTTILDALCLALYGRTPRLGRITRGGNEIMSRQTGACLAEVTFETRAGRFRCTWSQRRARRRPDGELQAPSHEIVDADTGSIFESNVKGVAERIRTATGMEFDQFTRSMVLAQGGFAVFLQATPDERSPILEQITGTEIYSRISVQVHERRSRERKALELLQAELAGMRFLTPEEETALTLELEAKGREDAELQDRLARTNEAVAWIGGVRRLEDELNRLEAESSSAGAKIEAFAPDSARLGRARRALELDADHSALLALRGADAKDRASLEDCRAALPGRAGAVEDAGATLAAAAAALAGRKSERESALPLLVKVRGLDLIRAGKEPPLAAERAAVAELETTLAALAADQAADTGELAECRAAIGEIGEFLAESAADENLIQRLDGLAGRFESAKALAARTATLREETETARLRLAGAQDARDAAAAVLEEGRRETDAFRRSLEERQADLLRILDGDDLPGWRRRRTVLIARKALADGALEDLGILERARREDAELERRRTAATAEEAATAAGIEAETERRRAAENEAGLLETQLSLLERIRDLGEARARLRDGEPCPLCGATEHPFALGNIPVPDETRRRLEAVRDELSAVLDRLAGLRIESARIRMDLERIGVDRRNLAETMDGTLRSLAGRLAELEAGSLPALQDPGLADGLEVLRDGDAQRLARAEEVLETADSMAGEIGALRDSLEKARDATAKRELEALGAAHEATSAGLTLDRLEKESAECGNSLAAALAALGTETGMYGIPPPPVGDLDRILALLAERRDRRVSLNRRNADLGRRIGDLEIHTRGRSERILGMQGELGRRRSAAEALLREMEALAAERSGLLGGKDPDDEERRLAEGVEAAGAELDRARLAAQDAGREYGLLESRIGELENAVRDRAPRLAAAEAGFLGRLGTVGFGDEEAYLAARLPPEERERLDREENLLGVEKTALDARKRETLRTLEAERAKRLAEASPEDLGFEAERLAALGRELQQEIGGIRQRLLEDAGRRELRQERLRVVDARRRECVRWDSLHELIGSADGKKYRNFVQGLTFEMLIGHANLQLAKLTDRYLLVHDDARPLELGVIDTYQAGEMRPTKNLSGGESFIVSLALALGLSHMASRNVRVDSLFLDEGFGTLDDEALDTALETLASLHQDGKLIGVISHVSALKERIATRIQVIPRSGGRSVISGPGCAHRDAVE